MGGFPPQGAGAGGGATADQIWGYSTRTLTQAKFPFWSAIITQTQGQVSIAATSTGYVIIQPPSGETWLIYIDSVLWTAGNQSRILWTDYDGTTARWHIATMLDGGNDYEWRHLSVAKVLTNTLYGRFEVYNPGAGAYNFSYGYSGFKLSEPKWSPKRLNDPPAQPWKKPTSLSLPSAIAPLQKYAVEILGLDPTRPNDYAHGVILEEDTPLAVDEKTGFPVERFTAVVKADVLADFIAKFKAKTADPVATGYRKYLDKWKAEGIDFGV